MLHFGMERMKIEIVEIGKVAVQAGMFPKAVGHQSSLRWLPSKQPTKTSRNKAPKALILKQKDVREEQKDTGKDACVVRQLLEEVLVVAWHKICIKEKSKIEENIKKHMEQTKTKIDDLTKEGGEGDIIVVPDVHMDGQSPDFMRGDFVWDKERTKSSAKVLGNHVMSLAIRKAPTGSLDYLLTNKKGDTSSAKEDISHTKSDIELIGDGTSQSASLEMMEMEYKKNNGIIQKEWEKMIKENKVKAANEKKLKTKKEKEIAKCEKKRTKEMHTNATESEDANQVVETSINARVQEAMIYKTEKDENSNYQKHSAICDPTLAKKLKDETVDIFTERFIDRENNEEPICLTQRNIKNSSPKSYPKVNLLPVNNEGRDEISAEESGKKRKTFSSSLSGVFACFKFSSRKRVQ